MKEVTRLLHPGRVRMSKFLPVPGRAPLRYDVNNGGGDLTPTKRFSGLVATGRHRKTDRQLQLLA
jgi:hypothetical protein